jgi:threonine/homoserine/homoserine lactone efflux protein
MDAFVKGMLTAFAMSLGIGPGMLINFRISLRRGFAAGLSVVAGLYVSVITFVAVNYFGVFHLIDSFRHRRATGIVCGIMLCVFGICMVLTNPKKALAAQPETDPLPLLKGFLSGVVVNITNPFVFLVWTTLMSIAAVNFGFRTCSFFAYLTGVVGTALCLDIVKSYLFSRMKIGITARLIAWINHGMGTILASGGIVMICRSIFVFG